MPETEPRKRVADAKRNLFARIIASAHLLDKPFSNAPEQSPWTGIKRAMEGLNAALDELDAAPATRCVHCGAEPTGRATTPPTEEATDAT